VVGIPGAALVKKIGYYLPLQVTDSALDQTGVATSPQALTVLQLLAGVDMAGSVLPPEVLAQAVVLACEEHNDKTECAEMAQSVQRAVKAVWDKHVHATTDPPESYQYADQSDWIRSRVRLPRVSLNEVVVTVDHDKNNNSNHQFGLQCTVNSEPTSLSVPLTETVLSEICYEYRPDVSAAFVAVALALRYKAPLTVVVNHSDDNSLLLLSESQLRERFPAYRAAADVLKPADRSSESITRGFEIHKLQAALQLARQKGDDAAAIQIRLALDRLDEAALDELPVQADTDLGSMQ